jgi:hypothetical protein
VGEGKYNANEDNISIAGDNDEFAKEAKKPGVKVINAGGGSEEKISIGN